MLCKTYWGKHFILLSMKTNFTGKQTNDPEQVHSENEPELNTKCAYIYELLEWFAHIYVSCISTNTCVLELPDINRQHPSRTNVAPRSYLFASPGWLAIREEVCSVAKDAGLGKLCACIPCLARASLICCGARWYSSRICSLVGRDSTDSRSTTVTIYIHVKRRTRSDISICKDKWKQLNFMHDEQRKLLCFKVA